LQALRTFVGTSSTDHKRKTDFFSPEVLSALQVPQVGQGAGEMSEFRALLTRETEKARCFTVADREVWVPRSVTKRITKLAPDAQGHRV
jgi:hypothetical protein